MAPSHWVVCKLCGRKFDVEKQGGVYDGSRYICKSCVKMMKKGEKLNRSTTDTKASSSWFSKNWKILFGVIFLIGGLGNIGKNSDAAIFGTLIGIGLTIMHFYSENKAKKQEKTQKEAELKAIDEEIKFCKICGAKTKGMYCEYCGSKLDS